MVASAVPDDSDIMGATAALQEAKRLIGLA